VTAVSPGGEVVGVTEFDRVDVGGKTESESESELGLGSEAEGATGSEVLGTPESIVLGASGTVVVSDTDEDDSN